MAEINAAPHTNDGEHIRNLSRCEQEHPSLMEALRAALIEGECSGPPRPLDMAAFEARMIVSNG